MVACGGDHPGRAIIRARIGHHKPTPQQDPARQPRRPTHSFASHTTPSSIARFYSSGPCLECLSRSGFNQDAGLPGPGCPSVGSFSRAQRQAHPITRRTINRPDHHQPPRNSTNKPTPTLAGQGAPRPRWRGQSSPRLAQLVAPSRGQSG